MLLSPKTGQDKVRFEDFLSDFEDDDGETENDKGTNINQGKDDDSNTLGVSAAGKFHRRGRSRSMHDLNIDDKILKKPIQSENTIQSQDDTASLSTLSSPRGTLSPKLISRKIGMGSASVMTGINHQSNQSNHSNASNASNSSLKDGINNGNNNGTHGSSNSSSSFKSKRAAQLQLSKNNRKIKELESKLATAQLTIKSLRKDKKKLTKEISGLHAVQAKVDAKMTWKSIEYQKMEQELKQKNRKKLAEMSRRMNRSRLHTQEDGNDKNSKHGSDDDGDNDDHNDDDMHDDDHMNEHMNEQHNDDNDDSKYDESETNHSGYSDAEITRALTQVLQVDKDIADKVNQMLENKKDSGSEDLSAIDQALETIALLVNENSQQKQSIEELNKIKSQLQISSLNDQMNQTEIKRLKKRLNEIQMQLNDKETLVNALETRNVNLDNQVKTKEEEILKLENELTDLKNENEKINKMNKINSNVVGSSGNDGGHSNNNSNEIDGDVESDFETKVNETLKKSYEKLDQASHQLTQKNETLENDIIMLKLKIDGKNSELEAIKMINDTLNQQLKLANEEKIKLRNELSQLRAKLSRRERFIRTNLMQRKIYNDGGNCGWCSSLCCSSQPTEDFAYTDMDPPPSSTSTY